MKFSLPEKISIFLASILTLIAAGLFGVIHYFAIEAYYPVLFFLGLILFFLIAAFSTRLTIYRFFYDKIRLLYKTIHAIKVNKGKKEIKEISRSANLQFVEKEVAEWASQRQHEIEELQERENFRREFIGNVSHELKTPIFNIEGYILTLLDGGIDDPEINLKYLQRAHKSVERMINLVQDMDMLNKLEGGIMELKMTNFNLIELILDVFDSLEENAKKRKIRLYLKNNPDKKKMVYADFHRIEQVLVNLVGNAIKYGKSQGYIEISIHDVDNHLMVDVKDNGHGIPKEDLGRIFERFYRVEKSRNRDIGGSGLGLSIVKHILDQHQQSISVDSKEGFGTTFSFTLEKGK